MLGMKNKSLQTKIMALNGAVVLSIAACVAYTIDHVVKREQATSMETLAVLASSANDAIQAQYDERYSDVQAFATNPQLRSRVREEIEPALDQYVALYRIYDLIIVTDLNGRVVGVNSKDAAGKPIKSQAFYGRSMADADWFKSAVAGKFTEDKDKGFLGTFVEDIHMDPYVAEAYGAKRPGNSFSTLLKDSEGKPIGVVTNRAQGRWYEEALANVMEAAANQDFATARVTLISNSGVVWAEVSADANGKPVPNHDPAMIGTLNLVEKGDELAKAVIAEQKVGKGLGIDVLSKMPLAGGYSPLAGPKWVSSVKWNVLVRDSKEAVFASARALIWEVAISLGVLFVAALAAGYFFSRTLAAQLREMAKGLSDNSSEVNDVSHKLAESSNLLSSSATEQAAALQETVASIDEVSAMVAKNADNAKRSQEISAGSAETAQKGKAAVGDMIKSIDEINTSNQQIVQQVEEGNRQISDIVKVITEIGNKTKVINDIVFQTKLLSFNASVEAARAGEHGKGFAVVAEEVGNLAQMSGNAAKEISQMLESSIAKVDLIVNETKTRVERLTSMSKEKVQVGTVTAQRCGEVLDEIVRSVGEVNVMVSEIATASKEQAQGVSEINKAMNQLDQVTQANASSSQDAAASAEQLRGESLRMAEIVKALSFAVEGAGGAAAPVAEEPTHRATTKSVAVAPVEHVAEKSAEPAEGKVVQFPQPAKAAKAKPAMKMAAGAENVPSHDDSRFEEV